MKIQELVDAKQNSSSCGGGASLQPDGACSCALFFSPKTIFDGTQHWEASGHAVSNVSINQSHGSVKWLSGCCWKEANGTFGITYRFVHVVIKLSSPRYKRLSFSMILFLARTTRTTRSATNFLDADEPTIGSLSKVFAWPMQQCV